MSRTEFRVALGGPAGTNIMRAVSAARADDEDFDVVTREDAIRALERITRSTTTSAADRARAQRMLDQFRARGARGGA